MSFAEIRRRRLIPAFPFDLSLRKVLPVLLIALLCAFSPGATAKPADSAELWRLLRDPTREEWESLAKFDGTITRQAFESRLNHHWDPEHGMAPYLVVADDCVRIYLYENHKGHLVTVRFAPDDRHVKSNPSAFRTPSQFAKTRRSAAKPLAGLKIAIDPADIGGDWAKMEDRSAMFKGYGLINEGELNVIVGRHIRARLQALGATVLLVRDKNEPVLDTTPEILEAETRRLMKKRPHNMPSSTSGLVKAIKRGTKWRIQRQAGLLYTKTLETRAREKLIQRTFTPDVTIILQHNATNESSKGKLTNIANRNIFFVSGMYRKSGLRYSVRRYHLLRKLFENVTPVESAVAGAISNAFKAETGYRAVMYGNSKSTKLVIDGNHYVVARNLMFTREHDGPTVVTEPYFMNHPVTIQRLLAGDYDGERVIAGKSYRSIFQEYADCVVQGILNAYGKE